MFPLHKTIISAKSAIDRTNSQATINTKYKEIERANKSISDIQKSAEIFRKNSLKREGTGIRRKKL